MSKGQLVTAAREYARAWLSRERHFVEDLASDDRARRLLAIQAAGGYFKISRSFALQFDVQRGLPRLAPALDALERVAPVTLEEDALPSTVDTLRRELGRPYGGKDLLSAATKFLWLRHRDTVIIHDSQVRSALGARSGDYSNYLALWRAEYTKTRAQILATCDAVARDGSAEVRSIATQEWFRRRVLDIHLWRVGAPSARISN